MKRKQHPRSMAPAGGKSAKPNRKSPGAGPLPGKRGRGRPRDTRLEKRDAIIAARVIRGIESYQLIAGDYGLSRERVRQIAKARIPQTGARFRRGSGKHGWCPRCRSPKKKYEVDGARRTCSVDVRNRLCGKCRREIYCQPVVLSCQCGKVKSVKHGLIRRWQQQGVSLGKMKLDDNGRTGTYLCRRCWYNYISEHGSNKKAKGTARRRRRSAG